MSIFHKISFKMCKNKKTPLSWVDRSRFEFYFELSVFELIVSDLYCEVSEVRPLPQLNQTTKYQRLDPYHTTKYPTLSSGVLQ